MDETTTAFMLVVAAAGSVGVLVGAILVLLLERYAASSNQRPDMTEIAPVETVHPDDIEILGAEPDFRAQAEDWARRAERPDAAGLLETKLRAIYDIGKSKGYFEPDRRDQR